jgi:hypothetical protein
MGIYDEQMETKISRIMGEELPFDDQWDLVEDPDQKYF